MKVYIDCDEEYPVYTMGNGPSEHVVWGSFVIAEEEYQNYMFVQALYIQWQNRLSAMIEARRAEGLTDHA